jgi:hypothetical protein
MENGKTSQITMVKIRIKYHHVILALYFILATIIFFFVARPAIDNEIPVRIWADSQTYVDFSRNLSGYDNLISLGANYLGPFLILKVTNFNYFLVLILNFSLLILSLELIIRNYSVERLKFTIFVLSNPLLFVSLLLINKEIVGLTSIAFLAAYIKNRKKSFLIATFVLAGLTRWHEVAVLIIFLILENQKFPFTKRRSIAFFGFFAGINIVFPIFGSVFSFINETSAELLESQTSRGFGVLPILNQLQYNYFYFFAFFPKILFNYVGNIFQVANVSFYSERLLLGDYYSLFIAFHQLWMLIFLCMIFFQKKFNINNTIFLFLAIYSLIYALNLFIQYRYFFPVTILIALLASQKTHTAGYKKRLTYKNEMAV